MNHLAGNGSHVVGGGAVGSPRHRNSTGSNSSQASSGFESMKSGSQWPAANIAVQQLQRGESPPSRSSVHSSGSSSLGSMERLDESGYSSQVNVAELVAGGLADHEVLAAWLRDLHYDEYVSLFLSAGYDMATVARMTPEDLTAIGITKPGHRKRLTMEIHRLTIADHWPDHKPASLKEWLYALRMPEYVPLFEAQGYRDVGQVMQLTWEDLEDVGVKRLGHLKKLVLAIKKLKEGRQARAASGENGAGVAGTELLLINVPPRSTAEVRPYSHLPNGNQAQEPAPQSPRHHPQQMTTFAHSPREKDSFLYQPEILAIGSANHRPHLNPYLSSNHLADENHGHNYDTFPPRHGKGIVGGTMITTEAVVHATNQQQQQNQQNGLRPKVTVKPRPVAKIVAKTKRSSGEVPQDIVYLDDEETLCKKSVSAHASPAHRPGNYVNMCITSTAHLERYGGEGGEAVTVVDAASALMILSRASPKKTPPPPPPKRATPSLASPAASSSTVFQLSATAPPVDELMELSPAPSVDELQFPPPPSPIRCEETIRHLRSIRQATAGPPAGVHQRLDRRHDSTASVDSSGSGSASDTLPFAQENVGTIRQKNGLGAQAAATAAAAVAAAAATPPRKPAIMEVFKAPSAPTNGPDVLDDIGNMLQDLSNELDALLSDRPTTQ